jgi:hypothetical protein
MVATLGGRYVGMLARKYENSPEDMYLSCKSILSTPRTIDGKSSDR